VESAVIVAVAIALLAAEGAELAPVELALRRGPGEVKIHAVVVAVAEAVAVVLLAGVRGHDDGGVEDAALAALMPLDHPPGCARRSPVRWCAMRWTCSAASWWTAGRRGDRAAEREAPH
jgi:hypothetical protein